MAFGPCAGLLAASVGVSRVGSSALLDLKELRDGVVAPLANAHCERNHLAPHLLQEPSLTLNKDSPTRFTWFPRSATVLLARLPALHDLPVA
jgi:hypothetical protein